MALIFIEMKNKVKFKGPCSIYGWCFKEQKIIVAWLKFTAGYKTAYLSLALLVSKHN